MGFSTKVVNNRRNRPVQTLVFDRPPSGFITPRNEYNAFQFPTRASMEDLRMDGYEYSVCLGEEFCEYVTDHLVCTLQGLGFAVDAIIWDVYNKLNNTVHEVMAGKHSGTCEVILRQFSCLFEYSINEGATSAFRQYAVFDPVKEARKMLPHGGDLISHQPLVEFIGASTALVDQLSPLSADPAVSREQATALQLCMVLRTANHALSTSVDLQAVQLKDLFSRKSPTAVFCGALLDSSYWRTSPKAAAPIAGTYKLTLQMRDKLATKKRLQAKAK